MPLAARYARAPIALLSLLLPCAVAPVVPSGSVAAAAQEPARAGDPPPTAADDPPGDVRTPTTSTRTLTAVLLALDAERKTVRLKPIEGGPGGDLLVDVDPECEYTRVGKGTGASLPAFVPGERVVARLTFRRSAAGREMVILRALWDEASYGALRRARTEVCAGRIVAATPVSLAVKRDGDGVVVAFRVTEKTRFLRFDRSVPSESFPAGERVAVKPRGLPGGGAMASLVAPTVAEVNAAYLDTLIRWEGTLKAVDRGAEGGPVVTLLRSDGTTRRLRLAPGAALRHGRKTVTPGTLPIGAEVRLHLLRERGEGGLHVADEVSVVTRRE